LEIQKREIAKIEQLQILKDKRQTIMNEREKMRNLNLEKRKELEEFQMIHDERARSLERFKPVKTNDPLRDYNYATLPYHLKTEIGTRKVSVNSGRV